MADAMTVIRECYCCGVSEAAGCTCTPYKCELCDLCSIDCRCDEEEQNRMTDAETRRQATDIARAFPRQGVREYVVESVLNLCRRVDAEARQEQREEDAKKCDRIAKGFRRIISKAQTETADTIFRLRMATASDCAAAIRNGETP